MRIKCIGCEALARLVYLEAALSPHIIDVDIVKLGYHVDPGGLRGILQEKIRAIQAEAYDAVVLAYGLCGKATYDLRAENIKLVIPKAHDCITLFLGSRERYKDQFENQPGTYWYALDYLQRNTDPGTALSLGAAELGNDLKSTYQAYVEKYGVDNADYLMTMMGAWQAHYQRAVYIDMGIGDGSEVEAQARRDSEQRGWVFEKLSGDRQLIHQLLWGEWNENFLILNPGERIGVRYDDEVMGAETNEP